MSIRYLRHAVWFPAFVGLLIIALAPPETAICLAPLALVSVFAVVRTLGRIPDRAISAREHAGWTLALAVAAAASIVLLEVV